MDDRTVAEVPLAAPVAPGQTVNVQIAWSSRVPRTFSRTGAIGNYYFLAQWFPKIGVFEDTGWNCHQFHAATEFFSDFGIYDVRLTVPNGWIVGATGIERGRRDEGDRTTTHHYHAEDVHDFAWTTSPDYVERVERFGHEGLPDVSMRLLLQPEHVRQAERHFNATRAALRYYGEWFGPYPYGNITVIDPAWQSGAGRHGVSDALHRGHALAGAAQGGAAGGRDGPRSRPSVLVRHRRDQRVRARVDGRGLQYVLDRADPRAVLRPAVLREAVLRRVRALGVRRSAAQPRDRRQPPERLPRRADSDVQSTPTWRYWPGTAGAITYNKTALWLNTLERMLGWETLQRILSTYFVRYSFAHPAPRDFFAVANEVSGRDLTWFFDQVYRSSNLFDYARRRLHERASVGPRILRRREPTGVLGRRAVRETSIARRSSSAAAATACSR